VPALGGTGTVQVATDAGCRWSASSSAGWLTIGGPRSGSGAGSFVWVAALSLLPSPRSATITVSGQTFTVTQEPLLERCSYAISPTSADVGGAETTLSVAVTTQTGCTWTAEQRDPWLKFGSTPSGTGSGTMKVHVERQRPNRERTGTMIIAGETFTVTQRKKNGGE
jgi:hypothetical protein